MRKRASNCCTRQFLLPFGGNPPRLIFRPSHSEWSAINRFVLEGNRVTGTKFQCITCYYMNRLRICCMTPETLFYNDVKTKAGFLSTSLCFIMMSLYSYSLFYDGFKTKTGLKTEMYSRITEKREIVPKLIFLFFFYIYRNLPTSA